MIKCNIKVVSKSNHLATLWNGEIHRQKLPEIGEEIKFDTGNHDLIFKVINVQQYADDIIVELVQYNSIKK